MEGDDVAEGDGGSLTEAGGGEEGILKSGGGSEVWG